MLGSSSLSFGGGFINGCLYIFFLDKGSIDTVKNFLTKLGLGDETPTPRRRF